MCLNDFRLHRIQVVSLSLLLLNLAGCAEAPLRGWGSQVTTSPGWEKFKHATVNAVKDPGTWVPAVGAVLMLASGRDEELTQEAIRESRVYGSMKEAADASDEHAGLLDKLFIASMLATSRDEKAWLDSKAKGIFAEVLIVNTSILTTSVLKKAVKRREPYDELDHVEYEAFPSHHGMPAFTRASLIRRNLRYSAVNDFSRYSLVTASYLLASSSAYGRIESGLHHFSDQLAGAALGNFLGLVLFDTFVEHETMWTLAIQPVNNTDGVLLRFSYAY